MAIALEGVGAAAAGNSPSSLSPPLPSVQTNDLLLCLTYARNGGASSISTPSGWTEVFKHAAGATIAAIALYRRIATGSDAPTISYSGGTNTTIAQVAAFSGPLTSNPVGVVGSKFDDDTTLDIGPIPGIALGAGGAVVVCGGISDPCEFVSPLTGGGLTWVQIGAPFGTAGSGARMAWFCAVNAGGATSVANKTIDVNLEETHSVPASGRMLSLNPSGVPAENLLRMTL